MLPALVAALLLTQRPENVSLRVGVLTYGTTLVLLCVTPASRLLLGYELACPENGEQYHALLRGRHRICSSLRAPR